MDLKISSAVKSSAATSCITLLKSNSVDRDQNALTGHLLNVCKIATKKGHLINGNVSSNYAVEFRLN